MEYITHLVIIIAFYTILAQSLNLISGYTGLISLAHASFFGIGAYTTAILSVNYGLSFYINIPLAMIISGLIAFLVSLISLRTINDYFVICTLGIQIIVFSLMNNLTEITNGPNGISGIHSIFIFGFDLNNKISFLCLCMLITIFIWYLLYNISISGFGKTLIAISEDEIYTKSIGKNVYMSKIVSFTLSAMLACIPGVLYAHYTSYIDPTSFNVGESILILSIVIIGGMGDLRGSFYASMFIILLPEILKYIGISNNIAANIRQIIYGLLLVIIMMNGKSGLREIIRNFTESPRYIHYWSSIKYILLKK